MDWLIDWFMILSFFDKPLIKPKVGLKETLAFELGILKSWFCFKHPLSVEFREEIASLVVVWNTEENSPGTRSFIEEPRIKGLKMNKFESRGVFLWDYGILRWAPGALISNLGEDGGAYSRGEGAYLIFPKLCSGMIVFFFFFFFFNLWMLQFFTWFLSLFKNYAI